MSDEAGEMRLQSDNLVRAALVNPDSHNGWLAIPKSNCAGQSFVGLKPKPDLSPVGLRVGLRFLSDPRPGLEPGSACVDNIQLNWMGKSHFKSSCYEFSDSARRRHFRLSRSSQDSPPVSPLRVSGLTAFSGLIAEALASFCELPASCGYASAMSGYIDQSESIWELESPASKVRDHGGSDRRTDGNAERRSRGGGSDRLLIQTQCNKWVFCLLHVPEADFRGEDN
ncbi:hypothetical protein B0H13DRAFT_1919495 [Mycena leptocephala]|nr:hypothetical protein B0H13DRAFT_1919495 [Mycena leptocephala]